MKSTRLCRLLVAALAIAGCKEKEEEKAPAAVVAAQTIVVTPQAFTETFGAIGTVVPRAGHIATLSAPSPGRVARVLVSAWQAVSAGQALVELDQAPFQAALKAAEAAYSAAERSNERQQRLASEGIVPRKDAEAAASDVARARAEVEAAQRGAQLSVLRAPIAGVVTRMTATIGASVDAAQPLVEISDPTSLDVLLNATPTDAARVHAGAKVTLSAGSTASGEPLGVGTVADVSAMVDSLARGVAVRVQAPTTRRPLRIGETVFGSIGVGTRPNAIIVPIEALVPDGEEFKVFVVDASSMAHERPVKIGGRTDRVAEVVEGLAAGERIVTYGAYGVSDSAKVQLQGPGASGPPKPAAEPAKKEQP